MRAFFSFALLIAMIMVTGCNKPAANTSSTANVQTQPDPNIPPPRSPADKVQLRITIPAMKTMDDFEKIRKIFYEYEKEGMDMVSLMQQAAEPAIDNPNLYIMFYPEFKKTKSFRRSRMLASGNHGKPSSVRSDTVDARLNP